MGSYKNPPGLGFEIYRVYHTIPSRFVGTRQADEVGAAKSWGPARLHGWLPWPDSSSQHQPENPNGPFVGRYLIRFYVGYPPKLSMRPSWECEMGCCCVARPDNSRTCGLLIYKNLRGIDSHLLIPCIPHYDIVHFDSCWLGLYVFFAPGFVFFSSSTRCRCRFNRYMRLLFIFILALLEGGIFTNAMIISRVGQSERQQQQQRQRFNLINRDAQTCVSTKCTLGDDNKACRSACVRRAEYQLVSTNPTSRVLI